MADIQNLEIELAEVKKDVQSVTHRTDVLEKKVERMDEITNCLTKMTTNMEHMVTEQKRQGEQLDKQGEKIDKLEKQPAEEARYYKREIIKYIILAIVGAIVGALLTYVFKQ